MPRVSGAIGASAPEGAGVHGLKRLYSLRANAVADAAPKPAAASPAQNRPGVSPDLLAETQAFALPAGIVYCAIVAEIFYFDVIHHSSAPASFYLGAGALAALAMAFTGRLADLHSVAAIVAGESKIGPILLAGNISFALLVSLLNLLNITGSFPWGWFALWYAFSMAFLVVGRYGILLWARLLRAETRLLQRVAVYGDPDLAIPVAERLLEQDTNLALAGVFADRVAWPLPEAHAGGMRELIMAAQCGICDRIVLAMSSAAKEELVEAIEELEVLPIDVQLCPDGMSLPAGVTGTHPGGLVLLDLQRPPLSGRGILLKMAMDYALGILALVGLSPVMLAIAAAIKLDSPGPVFFIQSRHGYNQRVIRVFKFRTMTVTEDGPVVMQAVKGDKRVTRVGRFLRRTSLDELPQLFNVMRGELSLVGPRPHALAHNESYAVLLNRYANRHKVKPGITGWAQVNGFRGETKTPEDMRKRVELDLYYIKNWSPWLDAQILARTALVPFHSPNAY
jgi:Undecaprenyl-phosphate glucose phosphotransferase